MSFNYNDPAIKAKRDEFVSNHTAKVAQLKNAVKAVQPAEKPAQAAQPARTPWTGYKK
jgi:outer membrane murein-binding lipoprotein Lpp